VGSVRRRANASFALRNPASLHRNRMPAKTYTVPAVGHLRAICAASRLQAAAPDEIHDLVPRIVRNPDPTQTSPTLYFWCNIFEGLSPFRVTEISMGGCFADLTVVIPHGTDVHLRVSKEDRTFEAEGRAVYIYPSMGIGVPFLSVSLENQEILDGRSQSLAR
jgi:hypothetical protein